jgi:hypothetical protein
VNSIHSQALDSATELIITTCKETDNNKKRKGEYRRRSKKIQLKFTILTHLDNIGP